MPGFVDDGENKCAKYGTDLTRKRTVQVILIREGQGRTSDSKGSSADSANKKWET